MNEYISIKCSTCHEPFMIRSRQTLEHQTERAHSGKMYTVHVIKEREE
jgi:hypothetical protein